MISTTGPVEQLQRAVDIALIDDRAEAIQGKHQWLYLNTLDGVETVRRPVAFYVEAQNTEIPHSAFRGQPPDQRCYGRGKDAPDKLKATKTRARAARLLANRATSCRACWPVPDKRSGALAAA